MNQAVTVKCCPLSPAAQAVSAHGHQLEAGWESGRHRQRGRVSGRSGLTDPVSRSESCDGPSGSLGLRVNIPLSGKAARTLTSPLFLLTHWQEEPAEVVQIHFIRLAEKAIFSAKRVGRPLGQSSGMLTFRAGNDIAVSKNHSF